MTMAVPKPKKRGLLEHRHPKAAAFVSQRAGCAKDLDERDSAKKEEDGPDNAVALKDITYSCHSRLLLLLRPFRRFAWRERVP